MHPQCTPSRQCACGNSIHPQSVRCRSCANRARWQNPDDPRRAKLIERWQDADDPRRAQLRARNQAVRGGNTPYQDREWLRSRYEDGGMSLRAIAQEASCGIRTIARWMIEHEIPTRDSVTAIRATDRSGSKSSGWRGGLTIAGFRCAECGARKGTYRHGGRCRRCYDARKRGAGNPNWKGLADVKALVRQWVADYWRPAVFARDRYACQQCGDARGHNLNAHHIVPLARIVAEKRRAWHPPLTTPGERLRFVAHLLTDPEITSLDNGLTLCKPCHRRHHLTIERAPGCRGY